jgi:hypothetical protein
MRHRHNDFQNTLVRGFADRDLQQRDERLRSFEREALGAEEFPANKLLKSLRFNETADYPSLFLSIARRPCFDLLDAVLQPLALQAIADMHELKADRTAVNPFKTTYQFAQC